jgi:oxygen-independent coproporphyrinogen-3 oxidase
VRGAPQARALPRRQGGSLTPSAVPATPPADRAPGDDAPARALYVHIPFCDTKCSYCDFYSLPGGRRGREPEAYLDALERELRDRVPPAFAPETVFVGGGTPTVLTADELRRLGDILRTRVDLARVSEFSVEANPGTLDAARLDALRDAGATRISVGVQSFDDRVLRSVGRRHSAADAREAVRAAVAAGFPRVSADLLFALPSQEPGDFARDLEEALALGTTHLSCYALLYEEGTALTARERKGLVRREDDERERAMLLDGRARVRAAGLRTYEISNFALPGHECAHNLVYWRNGPYLGVGAGATSFLGGERRTRIRDLKRYLEEADAGEPPGTDVERLPRAARLGETVMLGLRLEEGLDLEVLAARSGLDAAALLGPKLRRLAAAGLVAFDGARFSLTEDGIPLADAVSTDLMAAAEG